MTYSVEEAGKIVPHAMVMEDDDKFALAPIKDIEGGTETDYTKVKVYAKDAPEYPLEVLESYA